MIILISPSSERRHNNLKDYPLFLTPQKASTFPCVEFWTGYLRDQATLAWQAYPASCPSTLPLSVQCQEQVDTASTQQICSAELLRHRGLPLVVEPSHRTARAGLLSLKLPLRQCRVMLSLWSERRQCSASMASSMLLGLLRRSTGSTCSSPCHA